MRMAGKFIMKRNSARFGEKSAWSTYLIAMFLLLVQMRAYADWGYPEEDDAVMLDVFSHDRFLKEYDEVMVYYFIDDCKHCKEFKPTYHKLALEFKEQKRRVPLAQMDCTEHRRFCEEKMIPLFPFVKFFVKKHPILYKGKRSYKAVRAYLKRMTHRRPIRSDLPNFFEMHKQIFNPEQLDPSLFGHEELVAEINLRNRRKKTVMGVFFGNRRKNSKLFHMFDLYLKYDEHTEFFHVKKEPEVHRKNLKVLGDAMSEGDPLSGKVVLFFNGKSKTIRGKPSFDDFENAVHDLKFPKINFLDQKFYNGLGGKRTTIVMLFVSRGDHSIMSQFSRLANQYNRRFTFLAVAEDGEAPEMVNEFREKFLEAETLGFDLEKAPQLRLVEIVFTTINARRYIMSAPFTFDAGLSFIVDYLNDKITPFIKSETLESKFVGESRMRHVNGLTYKSVVKVPGQLSLVLYHEGLEDSTTKQFSDFMIKLSSQEVMKNVEFFAFDASKNELPDFYDDERPVLLCYSPLNHHSPLIYNQNFSKYKILKLIDSSRKVLTPEQEIKKILHGN